MVAALGESTDARLFFPFTVNLRDLGRQRVNHVNGSTTACLAPPSILPLFSDMDQSQVPPPRPPTVPSDATFSRPHFAHRVSNASSVGRLQFLIFLSVSPTSLRLTAFSSARHLRQALLILWDLFHPMPTMGAGYSTTDGYAGTAGISLMR